MKLCQTCQALSSDENAFCAHDGQPLMQDPIATTLQAAVGAKYSLTKLIGTGSMGAVYRAQHHALDDVAIKVMLGPPTNQKLSQRFLREAKALRKLRHPNSVLVYDLERSPSGLTYMVMEMVEGRSVRALLEQRGRLSLEESLEVAVAVCDALHAAHKHGIIHRDLKPDNILLADETAVDGSNSRTIKLADFGIVKLRGTQQGGEQASMQLTKFGAPIGTPLYMSPEQWFGDGPGFTALDGRTDIYALGCTLYEMIGGEPPFLGETTDELRRKHLNDTPRPLKELAPGVPDALSLLIARSLEKDRDLRPASPKEFAAELQKAAAGEGKQTDQVVTPVAKAPASPEPASAGRGKKSSTMQRTEESVPILKGWAAEESGQAIEQMRDQLQGVAPVPPATAAPLAPQVPEQKKTSAPPAITERSPVRKPAPPASQDELRQTLVMDRKAKRAPEPAAKEARVAPEKTTQLVVARAGGRIIGLVKEETEGVSTARSTVPLPHAPSTVLGVVAVRGRMLTLLDTLALIGEQRTNGDQTPAGFIVAIRGDEQLALAVDTIDEPVAVAIEKMTPLAEPEKSIAVRGVVRHDGGEIVVIETRSLFEAAFAGAERRRRRTGG